MALYYTATVRSNLRVKVVSPQPLAYPTGVWYNMRRFHEKRKALQNEKVH